MKKKYKIANTNLLIESKFDVAENGFSSLFASNFASPDFICYLAAVDEFNTLPPVYESKSMRVSRSDDITYTVLRMGDTGNEYVQLEKRDNVNFMCVNIKSICMPWVADMYYLMSAINLHGILLSRNTLMLHASFIEYHGRAFLFIGPSGVGKTTQAKLWENHFGAKIINGDRVAVQLDGENAIAHSVPLAGTSKDCFNLSLPLCAIISLSQATHNTLVRPSVSKAYAALVQNAVFNKWDSIDTEHTNDLICEIVSRIPVFTFACMPDKSAADLAHDTILAGGIVV